ncbi:MAG: hypothetical protein GY754_26395 [bacterium]|nr:hypothetical protein [bacterium]
MNNFIVYFRNINLVAVLILLLGGNTLYAADLCNKVPLGGVIQLPCEIVEMKYYVNWPKTQLKKNAPKIIIKEYIKSGSYKNTFLTQSGKVIAIRKLTDHGHYQANPDDGLLENVYGEVANIKKMKKDGLPVVDGVEDVIRVPCFKVDDTQNKRLPKITLFDKEKHGCLAYKMNFYKNYTQYKDPQTNFVNVLSQAKSINIFNRLKAKAIEIVQLKIKLKKRIGDFQYLVSDEGDLVINDPGDYYALKENHKNMLDRLETIRKRKYGDDEKHQAIQFGSASSSYPSSVELPKDIKKVNPYSPRLNDRNEIYKGRKDFTIKNYFIQLIGHSIQNRNEVTMNFKGKGGMQPIRVRFLHVDNKNCVYVPVDFLDTSLSLVVELDAIESLTLHPR